MFVSDIPQLEEQMAMTVSAEVRTVARQSSVPPTVYTICNIDFDNIVNDDYYSILGNYNNGFVDNFNAIELITIANSFFEGSYPLATKETEILNKALLKSLSKFPTKL